MKNNKQFPYKKTIQLIWDIEKKFDVSNIICNGVHIWPILRIAIYNDNLRAEVNKKKETSILQRIQIIPALLRVTFENFLDRKNNLKIVPSDIYFSSHVASRTYNKEGKWHDFIFSILIEWIQHKNEKLTVFFEEFSGDGSYRCPRYEPSYYFTRHLAIIKLKGMLFDSKYCTEETYKNILDIKEYLDKGNKRSDSLSLSKVNKRLYHFFQLASYYEKMLLQVKPKLVCVVTYYSLSGMALMHAANMQDINTLDMQHGVQGKFHVAYGTWYQILSNGYSCLPKQFWVWSDIDKNNLKMGKGHTGIAGGDIQNYYWKNKTHRNNQFSQKLLEIYQKNKTILLVSLQPGLEYLLDDVLEVITKKSFEHCFWLIRAHPTMNNATLQSLQEKISPFLEYCDLKTATSCRLSEVLNITSGHITVSSSVVIEAANEGISSLIYHESSELFLGLVDKQQLYIHHENKLLVDSLVDFLSQLVNQHSIARSTAVNPKKILMNIINTVVE